MQMLKQSVRGNADTHLKLLWQFGSEEGEKHHSTVNPISHSLLTAREKNITMERFNKNTRQKLPNKKTFCISSSLSNGLVMDRVFSEEKEEVPTHLVTSQSPKCLWWRTGVKLVVCRGWKTHQFTNVHHRGTNCVFLNCMCVCVGPGEGRRGQDKVRVHSAVGGHAELLPHPGGVVTPTQHRHSPSLDPILHCRAHSTSVFPKLRAVDSPPHPIVLLCG